MKPFKAALLTVIGIIGFGAAWYCVTESSSARYKLNELERNQLPQDLNALHLVLALASFQEGYRLPAFDSRKQNQRLLPISGYSVADYEMEARAIRNASERRWWYIVPKEVEGKELAALKDDDVLILVGSDSIKLYIAGVRKSGAYIVNRDMER